MGQHPTPGTQHRQSLPSRSGMGRQTRHKRLTNSDMTPTYVNYDGEYALDKPQAIPPTC